MLNRDSVYIEIRGRQPGVGARLSLNNFEIIKTYDLAQGTCKVFYTSAAEIAFYIFATEIADRDEVEYEIVLANGFPHAGPFEFNLLNIYIDRQPVYQLEGNHVIPPRLALARRFTKSEHVRKYRHLAQFCPQRPQYIKDKLRESLVGESQRYAFGPYEAWGEPSPYAHGGQRVAPFHAQWWECPEGFQLAQAWFNGTTDRSRIVCIDRATGGPLKVPYEYTLTRGDRQLPGYEALPDDSWCPYGHIWYTRHYLGGQETHDGQHGRRLFSEPLALRQYSGWANLWLDFVHNDFSIAWTMDRATIPIDPYWKPNGYTLFGRLDATPRGRGAAWAGREIAHVMMLAAYLDKDIDIWQGVIDHIAKPNGMMQSIPASSWQFAEARSNPPGMTGSITQTFESMMLQHACSLLGRPAVAHMAAQFLGSHPKWFTDTDTGYQANKANQSENAFVSDYSAFTVGDYSEYLLQPGQSLAQNIKSIISTRSLSDTPFDSIPPQDTEELIMEQLLLENSSNRPQAQ